VPGGGDPVIRTLIGLAVLVVIVVLALVLLGQI
jgi:hypothetical protein